MKVSFAKQINGEPISMGFVYESQELKEFAKVF